MISVCPWSEVYIHSYGFQVERSIIILTDFFEDCFETYIDYVLYMIIVAHMHQNAHFYRYPLPIMLPFLVGTMFAIIFTSEKLGTPCIVPLVVSNVEHCIEHNVLWVTVLHRFFGLHCFTGSVSYITPLALQVTLIQVLIVACQLLRFCNYKCMQLNILVNFASNLKTLQKLIK